MLNNETQTPIEPAPEPAWSRPRRRTGWLIFGLAMVGLVVLAGWLTIAKLWRTSPAGAEPVIQVSVLDLFQARSLGATARQAAAGGKHAQAIQAWGSALGNNLADLGLWRELLSHLDQSPAQSNTVVNPFLGRLDWFCLLAETNVTDVTLAARVCEKHEAFERLLALPVPASPEDAVELTALRLKGLFRVGRMYEFIPLFERNQERLAKESSFELYRLAYLAGWGEPTDRQTWREQLSAAAEDSNQERLGRKLGIIVANQTGDPATAGRLLQELSDAGEASVLDHALLWLTLAGADRKPEALQAAAACRQGPQSATELDLVAAAWLELGLTNQCAQLLAQMAPVFGCNRTPESANVWMTWAAVTMQSRDWTGLRNIAEAIGTIPGNPGWLQGYADFLEGYGAHQMAEGPLAENRLRRAATADYPVGNLGVAAANGLSTLGHFDSAEAILRPLEERFQHNPVYWRAVWSVALRRHADEDRLIEAATRLHELEPSKPITRFNYAAALLVRRERPAEALKILWDLRQTSARHLYTELNYAMALIRNGRHEEAREILSPINAAALTDVESPSYHLCQLELHLAAGDTNRAAASFAAIDQGGFFPCQVRWLEETAKKLAVTE